MVSKEEVREILPLEMVEHFDDIVYSRALGASNQTKIMCNIVASILADKTSNCDQNKKRVKIVIEYFLGTRGQNSRAIYNALFKLDKEIDSMFEQGKSEEEVISYINDFSKMLNNDSLQAAKIAAKLCEQFDSIMIFDYSSTVMEFIGQLSSRKELYIPESRALNGGKPFLNETMKKMHNVHFIPDTCMMVELKKCQAAFIGAESIYPDGSVFNTIGADILAVICKELNIPLYAITSMIKIDTRSLYGFAKAKPMDYDYSVRLATNWSEEEKNLIDFTGIKLVKIESKYMSAIITEKGIIPPYSMYVEAKSYGVE